MKWINKIACIALAASSLTSLFGCSIGKDSTEISTMSPGTGYVASKEPLELTIHMNYWNSEIFNNDWPVFKKAAEFTNISLKGTVAEVSTDSAQSFNIMIASGSLPDIIHYTNDALQKYGLEGALIPLNDLIDKHAPNIKAYLEENPDVKRHITAIDGNIYDISFIADGIVSKGYFIRKDWLDKLGIGIPKTIDEFYYVMKKFSENDMNENGKKDEIPYFNRDKSELMRFVELFGGRKDWYVSEDGKVGYGPSEKAYFDTIKTVSNWYSEGLIDKEIFTRGNKGRDELLGNNLSGITYDWFASTASYNEKLKDKIIGFNFVPMLPPADINGEVWGEARNLLSPNAWGISHSNKYPSETIRYFDFWFTEEGRRLANFGIEGEQYTMVDGKPTFTDNMKNSDQPVLAMLKKVGAQMQFGYKQDFYYEEQAMNEIANEGVSMYQGIVRTPFPTLLFTELEKKNVTSKLTAITTYISEKEQSFILNNSKAKISYEEYKAEIDGMGLSDVIKIYQTVYDRYVGSN